MRHSRGRDLPLARTDNPLEPVMRFLDSSMFLSFVAFVIVCTMAWAVWKG
jgi:hypothetical protein